MTYTNISTLYSDSYIAHSAFVREPCPIIHRVQTCLPLTTLNRRGRVYWKHFIDKDSPTSECHSRICQLIHHQRIFKIWPGYFTVFSETSTIKGRKDCRLAMLQTWQWPWNNQGSMAKATWKSQPIVSIAIAIKLVVIIFGTHFAFFPCLR